VKSSKSLVGVLAAFAMIAAAAAHAQPGSGYGPGPGYGMGPGMMGGYGEGYGPGGGYGMGPGCGGGGGYGPGPGYGMGPGMMRGYGGGYGALDLSDEQRGKIAKIQEESARQRWELMGKMHEQGFKMRELYASGKPDDAALRQAYDTMAAMRKSMFENSLETRKKIDAMLTNEQREQLQRGWRGRKP